MHGSAYSWEFGIIFVLSSVPPGVCKQPPGGEDSTMRAGIALHGAAGTALPPGRDSCRDLWSPERGGFHKESQDPSGGPALPPGTPAGISPADSGLDKEPWEKPKCAGNAKRCMSSWKALAAQRNQIWGFSPSLRGPGAVWLCPLWSHPGCCDRCPFNVPGSCCWQ